MHEDKANGLLTGLGALAESLGFFYDCLIEEGFDREQAMEFCGLYLTSVVAPKDGF